MSKNTDDLSKLVVSAGVALLCSLFIMLIVNYVFTPKVLVEVFGGPLNYWKSMLLYVFSNIVFKTPNVGRQGK